MWQKCPICDGTGKRGIYDFPCDVCKGKKIIHSSDGHPPSDINMIPPTFKEAQDYIGDPIPPTFEIK